MALMVFHVLQENENFINVINHEIIQVFTKDIIPQMLKKIGALVRPNGIITYSKWS